MDSDSSTAAQPRQPITVAELDELERLEHRATRAPWVSTADNDDGDVPVDRLFHGDDVVIQARAAGDADDRCHIFTGTTQPISSRAFVSCCL